jgi:hypothetical protein
MHNDATDREFYRHILHVTEAAQGGFLLAVERAIEVYFADNSQKQPRRSRILNRWRNNLLLYGEVESLSLLDVAILTIHKNQEGI